jgi:type IV pilus assembly protein PilE
MSAPKRNHGFTLIELMVVVTVIAILAAFAIPNYVEQVRRSRRSEAIQTLQDLALRQERFRVDNATFGATANFTATTVLGTIPTSNYYTYSVPSAASPTTFTLRAEPVGNQANDCGGANLELVRAANGTYSKTPANCWQGRATQ